MVATLNAPNLRTVNRLAEAQSDYDIYKHNPWRAPGSAPVLDSCGAAGGQPWRWNISAEYGPDGCQRTGCWYQETIFAEHGDMGSQTLGYYPTDAEWTIGGEADVIWQLLANHGGGYQYRLCPLGSVLDEKCFQSTPLDFNPNKHALQFNNGTKVFVEGTFVSEGTLPVGGMWAMNPIPARCLGNNTYNPCKEVNVCTPCPDNLSECTSCDNTPDVKFPTPCEEGSAQGTCSGNMGLGTGSAPAGPVSIADSVLVPSRLQPGAYVLGWRYDSEPTQQVWSNCADINLVLPSSAAEKERLAREREEVHKAIDAALAKSQPPSAVEPPRTRRALEAAMDPSAQRPPLLPAEPVDPANAYGYPAEGVFGIQIAERHPYPNGPSLWPDDPWGSFAMFNAAPVGFVDSRCASIPEDSPLFAARDELSPFALHPINGLGWCLLGCNKTAVALTGSDPCAAGSLPAGQNATDGRGEGGATSRSDMACYDVGPNMSPDGGAEMGACGFNCTLLQYGEDSPVPCTEEDLDAGKCSYFCDSRTFPGAE